MREQQKMIKNKVVKNASWLIGCKTAQSAFSLVISMLTARYLGPSNYGVISYAASIVAFVVPILHLGLNNVLVQETVQHPEGEGKIYGTAILSSICMSFICIIGVTGFVSIANRGNADTIIVCGLYSVLLIFQALELIQYWFQAKYLAKYTAIISLCAYVVVSAYKIFLLATGKSVYWFAISNALDYMLIAIASLITYQKLGGQRLKFSKAVAKRMISSSKYYIVSGLMVTVFAQTDKVMLTLMIDEASTGFYSIATTCVGMTGYVFTAIIDSMRPKIFECQYDSNAFDLNVTRLYSIVIYLALIQSVAFFTLAKPIILLLYGAEYVPSIKILQVLVWYTAFSYLGGAKDIWILAKGKQKYLILLYLIGAVTNILLNLCLIPSIGAVGAAVASLITQFISNIVACVLIKPLRGNVRLFIKALNPIAVFGLKFKKDNH